MIDPMGEIGAGCWECKAFDRVSCTRCKAFLDGIPIEITSGEVSHTKSFPGDHGIQFEAI